MRWPPYKHVFFDCDSTLTTVEGIDVLAAGSGRQEEIESLTQAAMDGKMDLEDVYAQRLQQIHPSRRQIQEVYRIYKRNPTADAATIVQALSFLGHQLYIVSGGLAEAVKEFGVSLGFAREHIRAVDVAYDQLAGTWWQNGRGQAETNEHERYLDFDAGALTVSDGKAKIVAELMAGSQGRSLLVGDGVSDLLAGQAVDLFVGYGGVVRRKQVEEQAPVYIHSESLAPILALAAGPAGLKRLARSEFSGLVAKIRKLINEGAITFRDEELRTKFRRAVHATQDTPH